MPTAPVTVHDLKEQTKDSKIGRTTAKVRCGEEFHRNSAERLPENVTAWPSLVTCSPCKESAS